MADEPLIFRFGIADFDLRLLPIDAELLKSDPAMLEEAVADAYAEQFRRMGGQATITIAAGVVTVRWLPDADVGKTVEQAGRLLARGDYATGLPILRSLLAQNPDHPGLLYNLGMALGDRGELEDSLALLERLTRLTPGDPMAWTALGMALARSGRRDEAAAAFRRSLSLNPDEGHALRNLGGMLVDEAPAEALPHLRRAAELLPEDQAARYGYGVALLRTGAEAAAEEEFIKAIDLNPLSDIAEVARTARRDIAHRNMRSAGGGLRRDVVLHCLSALRLFRREPEKLRPVTFEIVVLGRQGLDINNPASKYTLTSLPGEFSGMQLVAYMYVGFKALAPEHDAGIDLSAEYDEAMRLFNAQPG